MDQSTNNSGSTDSTGSTGSESRPSVLNDMSETQLQELERAYTDGSSQYFDELAQSYGWSEDDMQAVRQHFDERVQGSGEFGRQGGQQ